MFINFFISFCFSLRGIINREVNVTKKIEDYPHNISFQLFKGYYVHIEDNQIKDDFNLTLVRIGQQKLWLESNAVDIRKEYGKTLVVVSLREKNDMKSKILSLIHKNETIIVLDIVDDFLYIEYKGLYGYIQQNTTDYKEIEYPGKNLGEKAAYIVRTKLGCPYVWAAQGPFAFDCSGLMQFAYNRLDFFIMRDAHEQIEGTEIPQDESKMLPGDIITFYTDEEQPDYISHVGMYVGNGKFIHASTTGYVVREQEYKTYPYPTARISRYFTP